MRHYHQMTHSRVTKNFHQMSHGVRRVPKISQKSITYYLKVPLRYFRVFFEQVIHFTWRTFSWFPSWLYNGHIPCFCALEFAEKVPPESKWCLHFSIAERKLWFRALLSSRWFCCLKVDWKTNNLNKIIVKTYLTKFT